MNHTITTEQIKRLYTLGGLETAQLLKEAFPAAFSTIMDRVKTVEDAQKMLLSNPLAWKQHAVRARAFEDASLVHTALCEGWVFKPGGRGFCTRGEADGHLYHLPFWFESEAKRDYFQTQFAALLTTIITGKP